MAHCTLVIRHPVLNMGVSLGVEMVLIYHLPQQTRTHTQTHLHVYTNVQSASSMLVILMLTIKGKYIHTFELISERELSVLQAVTV